MAMHISSFVMPEETFTWVSSDGKENVHIAVARLNAMLAHRVPDICMFPPGIDKFLMNNRGIDMKRVRSLTDEELAYPVIMLVWGNEHLLADGAHRVVRHIREGKTQCDAWIVPEVIWRMYQIVGITKHLTGEEVLKLSADYLPQRQGK